MQVSDGKFVSAELGGGLKYIGSYPNQRYPGVAPLYGNRFEPGDWEKFELIENSNGSVSIKTNNGNYWTAELAGGNGLSTNRLDQFAWEEFTLVDLDNDNYALKCVDNIHYVTSEQGSDTHLNCTRTSTGIWETFHINFLDKPVINITEEELRAFKGNYCGLVIPELQYGPQRNNGRILFTPGYVCENSNVRKIIRNIYKSEGYTHFPLNIRNVSSIYRDMYPPWDESLINVYLNELWADDIIPVCSVFPDNSTDINRNVDANLVRIAFWWEDSHPIKYPANDQYNKFYIAQSVYKDAIIYWHNPPYQDAPYIEYADWGLAPTDLANPVVWNYIVRNNNVKGILFQGKAWESNDQYEGWQRSALSLRDYIPRFHGTMYGLPFPLDIHDFEETAYYLFNEHGDVNQAYKWVKQIRDSVPELDGYCNG